MKKFNSIAIKTKEQITFNIKKCSPLHAFWEVFYDDFFFLG